MQNKVEVIENKFDLTVHADAIYGEVRIKI